MPLKRIKKIPFKQIHSESALKEEKRGKPLQSIIQFYVILKTFI